MSVKSIIYKILYKIAPASKKKQLVLLKLGHHLVSSPDSYLVATGYIQSKIHNALIDENNEPLPWMNYSFISFLKERLTNTLSVF